MSTISSAVELIALVGTSGAVAVVLARSGRAVRPRPEHRFRRAPSSDAPDPLRRLERIVEGAGWAGELHLGLRPLLREIAAAALGRHGIDPERDPASAVALLGADLWELVRPDREPPSDRFAPGLDRRRVAGLLSRLEEL